MDKTWQYSSGRPLRAEVHPGNHDEAGKQNKNQSAIETKDVKEKEKEKEKRAQT